MTLPRLIVSALAAVVCCLAEQGVMALRVGNPQGKPLAGIVLATMGDGSAGAPTDKNGKTRLRLAEGTRAKDWVTLQVAQSPKELVFLSPWDGRVAVPRFSNESDNFVPVVLAERGDRAMLENGRLIASLAAKVNLEARPRSQPAAPPVPQEQALKQVAEAHGLEPAALEKALRDMQAKSKDPYEKGMSALFNRQFGDASDSLANAVTVREKSLKKVPMGIVNAAVFLGRLSTSRASSMRRPRLTARRSPTGRMTR